MKRASFLILFLTSILFMSCETDFSVNGDYEEKVIVHAIIDANDTIHYFKINKTFLGDGNALEFAQVPDSSYFDDVQGTITEFVAGTNIREWELRDTLITNKEDGIFYAPEQKVYYFATPSGQKLNPDAIMKMRLEINGGRYIVTGETALVNGVEVTDPSGISSLSFANQTIQDNSDYKNESFKYSLGNNAVLYNYKIRINYRETTNSGNVDKSILWNIGQQDEESASLGLIRINGIQFFEFIESNIPIDNNVTKRVVSSMDFIVTGASEELQKYILLSEPSSSLAQSKPSFNGSLDGALGIFTSRMTSVLSREAFNVNVRILHQNTMRQLCEGPMTGFLSFCSNNPNDNSFSFYCN